MGTDTRVQARLPTRAQASLGKGAERGALGRRRRTEKRKTRSFTKAASTGRRRGDCIGAPMYFSTHQVVVVVAPGTQLAKRSCRPTSVRWLPVVADRRGRGRGPRRRRQGASETRTRGPLVSRGCTDARMRGCADARMHGCTVRWRKARVAARDVLRVGTDSDRDTAESPPSRPGARTTMSASSAVGRTLLSPRRRLVWRSRAEPS
jgi:hypothetical protein